MSRPRTYTDQALAEAVARATSWRGVLRELGLAATSSSSIASVRRRAEGLGLDIGHVTGRRNWSDAALRTAVEGASSWRDVVTSLGLTDESRRTVRARAARLALDTCHLDDPTSPSSAVADPRPTIDHLRDAGPLLAAAWFTLSGHHVAWPLEPCRYDLVVERDGALRRVQVKTATRRDGASWIVWISTTGRGRRPYEATEIDDFFVVDADLGLFLVPLAEVAGMHAIHLSAYERFRLPGLDHLVPRPSSA